MIANGASILQSFPGEKYKQFFTTLRPTKMCKTHTLKTAFYDTHMNNVKLFKTEN